MSWPDSYDAYENEKPKKTHRKSIKRENYDEDDTNGRQKRSSKREHRRRAQKDIFWEENLR